MFVCKDAVFLLETYQDNVETEFFVIFLRTILIYVFNLRLYSSPIPQASVLDNNAVPE